MRTIDSGAATTLSSAQVPLALLVEMQLSSALYLNTSPNSIDYNGNTWLGAGTLGTIDVIEDAGGERKQLKFTLSGVPSSQISLVLSEQVRNKVCNVYAAILNATTWAVQDAPLVWTGTLDQMTIQHSADTCVISATAEHIGVLFSRPKPLRNTDADQQKLVPGDTSRRFVVSQSQHQDIWPAAAFFRQ